MVGFKFSVQTAPNFQAKAWELRLSMELCLTHGCLTDDSRPVWNGGPSRGLRWGRPFGAGEAELCEEALKRDPQLT